MRTAKVFRLSMAHPGDLSELENLIVGGTVRAADVTERYRIQPEFAVKVDPSLGTLGVLLEPTSVVAKAWEQVDRIGGRAHWDPRTAVVTGAGPIGLLAALLGVQRGLEVHVIDRVTDGLKPELVAQLGATYHTGPIADAVDGPDVVLECTGVSELVFDAIEHAGTGGVVCLTGVSSGGRSIDVNAGTLNRNMVLENEAVVGSVNANRTPLPGRGRRPGRRRPDLAVPADHPAGTAGRLGHGAGPRPRRRQGGDRGHSVVTGTHRRGAVPAPPAGGGVGGRGRPAPDHDTPDRGPGVSSMPRDTGGGGSGIRTHGALRHNGFRDRPIRPLSHPSGRRG